jgi:predicted DNA-binding transcriptional regulator AlpA
MVDRLLSVGETCKALAGCSTNTLYRYVRRGRLPKPAKIGTRSGWRESDVQALIDTLCAEQVMGQNAGQDGEGQKKAA